MRLSDFHAFHGSALAQWTRDPNSSGPPPAETPTINIPGRAPITLADALEEAELAVRRGMGIQPTQRPITVRPPPLQQQFRRLMREAGLDRMAALSLGRPAGQLAELPAELLALILYRAGGAERRGLKLGEG